MTLKEETKQLLIVILTLLGLAQSQAQTPDLFFEHQFPYHSLDNPPHSIFGDKPCCYVIEVNPNGEAGFCLMTVNHDRICINYETEPVSPPLVYKVSLSGELLGELTIGYDDRHAFVEAVYQTLDDPQHFLAVGRVHDNNLHLDKPFIAKFDQDLSLLWRREVELPEPYQHNISFGSVMDSDGNIFCSSYLYSCGDNSFSRFCFRLTPEGALDGLCDLPLQSQFQKVFEYPDGSGDYGLLENVEQDYQSTLILLRFDRDLEQVGQRTIPQRYLRMNSTNTQTLVDFRLVPPQHTASQRHAMVPCPDGSFVLANEAMVSYRDELESYNGNGFLWVSPEGESVSCAMDWQQDIMVYDTILMIEAMIHSDDNSFYFVYNMGKNNAYDYMPCFVVGKMDEQGHLLWRRYWNRYLPEYGLKNYYAQDAVTTHDGGCLITGFSFESSFNSGGTYVYKPDVFLLKFFADGTLSVPQGETMARPYACFPNPAGNTLHIDYSPDVKPSAVELYDIQGRLLRTQNRDLGSVNMESLPSGTYTLRVVMDDGTYFSDKVVKR